MKWITKIKDCLILRWLKNDECPYFDECQQGFIDNCDNIDDCMQGIMEAHQP